MHKITLAKQEIDLARRFALKTGIPLRRLLEESRFHLTTNINRLQNQRDVKVS